MQRPEHTAAVAYVTHWRWAVECWWLYSGVSLVCSIVDVHVRSSRPLLATHARNTQSEPSKDTLLGDRSKAGY